MLLVLLLPTARLQAQSPLPAGGRYCLYVSTGQGLLLGAAADNATHNGKGSKTQVPVVGLLSAEGA
jgi:hypothetical protein